MNRSAWILLAALAFAGCQRGEPQTQHAQAARPDTPAVVFFSSRAQASLEGQFLAELFPGLLEVRPRALEADLERCRAEHRPLIVPHIRDLPAWSIPHLNNFQAEGGSIVFWGLDPLAGGVRGEPGKPVSLQDHRRSLAGSARELGVRFGIQGWSHRDPGGLSKGKVRQDRQALVPWEAVQVELPAFTGQDLLISPPLDEAEIREEENTLVFYARGDVSTSHLVLKAASGEHTWMRIIPLSREWTLWTVHQEDFQPLESSSPPCRLSNLEHLSIGLDNRHAVQPPGGHLYGISNVRLAADTLAPSELPANISPWLIGPETGVYGFPASELRGRFSRGSFRLPGTSAQSVLRPPSSAELSNGTLRTWSPVCTAHDTKGALQGWPVSLFREFLNGRMTRQWAWIGLELDSNSRLAMRSLFKELTDAMASGWSMFPLESFPVSLEHGQPIELKIGYSPGHDPEPKRMIAELIDFRGQSIRRVASPRLDESRAGGVALKLGTVPPITRSDVDVGIRILLENIGGQNEIFDEIFLGFKALSPGGEGNQAWLSATGPRITEGKSTRFMLGANYYPSTGWPDLSRFSFLEPDCYHPDLVRRDLDMLAGHGFNAISVELTAERELPAFRHLLDEAARRQLSLCLVLPSLDPWNPDLDLALRLLDGIDARHQDTIAAIELGRRGSLSSHDERMAINGAWKSWIEEQFGSVDHAFELLKPYLDRIGPDPLPPPGEILAADGEHRVAVSVYRRFVQDALSRRTGYLVRLLREEGFRQLLGLRIGEHMPGAPDNATTMPYLHSAGAVHTDYTTLSGWNFSDPIAPVQRLLFLTALARGVSGNKPVLWRDFGFPVLEGSINAQERELERIYQQVFYAAVKGKASGLFAGAGAGTPEPLSLWTHDGRLLAPIRPFRGFANTTRSLRGNPKTWSGTMIDLFESSRGENGLWDLWKDRYPEPLGEGSIEELRPLHFGKSSLEIEPVLPGTGIYDAPAPIQSINAEWGWLSADGQGYLREPGAAFPVKTRQKLRLELINTGPITWMPGKPSAWGSVNVAAAHDSGRVAHLRVERTAHHESFQLEWTIPAPGTWTLRPELGGIGPFGEALTVTAEP